jgi:hypothetical protein
MGLVPYFAVTDSKLPFSSPRRAKVEVFDPASTRDNSSGFPLSCSLLDSSASNRSVVVRRVKNSSFAARSYRTDRVENADS